MAVSLSGCVPLPPFSDGPQHFPAKNALVHKGMGSHKYTWAMTSTRFKARRPQGVVVVTGCLLLVSCRTILMSKVQDELESMLI